MRISTSGTGSIGLTALEGAVGTVTGEGAGVSFLVESDADDSFPLFKEPVEVDNFMIIVCGPVKNPISAGSGSLYYYLLEYSIIIGVGPLLRWYRRGPRTRVE